jgi:hypothetical protein
VSGDTITGNTADGFSDGVRLDHNSVVYQTLNVFDTALDHNGGDGLYSRAYVAGGSHLLQTVGFYAYSTATSASNNTADGVYLGLKAVGGSQIISSNNIYGVDLSNNNNDGIKLYVTGAGASQKNYIGTNEIENNALVGVYGEANTSAYQLVSIYTLGNTVTGNGTPYLFNVFGGATHNIY